MGEIRERLRGRGARGVTTGPGWDEILTRLADQIEVLDPDYVVFEVKSKFGGLRFLCGTRTADEYARAGVMALVGDAAGEAERTCEFCGKPGVLRVRYVVACDADSGGSEPLPEDP